MCQNNDLFLPTHSVRNSCTNRMPNLCFHKRRKHNFVHWIRFLFWKINGNKNRKYWRMSTMDKQSVKTPENVKKKHDWQTNENCSFSKYCKPFNRNVFHNLTQNFAGWVPHSLTWQKLIRMLNSHQVVWNVWIRIHGGVLLAICNYWWNLNPLPYTENQTAVKTENTSRDYMAKSHAMQYF